MDALQKDALPREAVLKSAQLIAAQPRILWLFYRNTLLLAGFGLLSLIVIGAAAQIVPLPIAAVVVFALVAVYAWMLSATALSTIILMGVGTWNGSPVSMLDARNSMRQKVFRAMTGDLVGALQLAVIGVLSILPLLAPSISRRFTAFHRAFPGQAGLGTLSYGHGPAFFAFVIVMAILGAIFSAYSALALRKIATSDITPRAALRDAHAALRLDLDVYRWIILFVAIMHIAVASLNTFLLQSQLSGGFNTGDFSGSFGSLIMISILGSGVWAMEILPYVWAAEKLDGKSALPTFERLRPSRTTDIASKIGIVIGAVFLIICVAIAGFSFWIIHAIGVTTKIHSHVNIRDFGLADFPAGYSANLSTTMTFKHMAGPIDLVELSSNQGTGGNTISIEKISNGGSRADAPSPAHMRDSSGCSVSAGTPIALQSGIVPVELETCTSSIGTSTTIKASLATVHPSFKYTVSDKTLGTALDTSTFSAVVRSISLREHAYVPAPTNMTAPSTQIGNAQILRAIGLETLPDGFRSLRGSLSRPFVTSDGSLSYLFAFNRVDGHIPGTIRVTAFEHPTSGLGSPFASCADDASTYESGATTITRHERTCKPAFRPVRHIDEYDFTYRGRYFTIAAIPQNTNALPPDEQRMQAERVVQWILNHAA